MNQNVYTNSAKSGLTSGQSQTVRNRLVPGRFVLPFLLLLLALQLPDVLVSMLRLWPMALRVYILTMMVYWVSNIKEPINLGRLVKIVTTSALPLLLLFPSYLAVTSLFNLDHNQAQLLMSIGLSVTYFNLGAVIFSGRTPLDGGKMLPDGRRILGDGKTVQGTIGGLISAMLIGWVTVTGAATGLLIGFLTMLGDLIASFVKRRLGLARGSPVIILDQLDSIILLLLLEMGSHIFGLDHRFLLTLILATFFIQVCGNYFLFLAGKKQVPW